MLQFLKSDCNRQCKQCGYWTWCIFLVRGVEWNKWEINERFKPTICRRMQQFRLFVVLWRSWRESVQDRCLNRWWAMFKYTAVVFWTAFGQSWKKLYRNLYQWSCCGATKLRKNRCDSSFIRIRKYLNSYSTVLYLNLSTRSLKFSKRSQTLFVCLLFELRKAGVKWNITSVHSLKIFQTFLSFISH